MSGPGIDASTQDYYDHRAPEYDDWYLGHGLFADRVRPGFHDELSVVLDIVAGLDPALTLDVACGTGFVTQHLPRDVVALDASPAMLDIARTRVQGTFVRGDALSLPFATGEFDRLFTGHLYGHMQEGDRERFLLEARRVAPELIVLDAALRDEVQPEEVQTRVLADGYSHQVLKRFFAAKQLLRELGGGRCLFEGRWFVLVTSPALEAGSSPAEATPRSTTAPRG